MKRDGSAVSFRARFTRSKQPAASNKRKSSDTGGRLRKSAASRPRRLRHRDEKLLRHRQETARVCAGFFCRALVRANQWRMQHQSVDGRLSNEWSLRDWIFEVQMTARQADGDVIFAVGTIEPRFSRAEVSAVMTSFETRVWRMSPVVGIVGFTLVRANQWLLHHNNGKMNGLCSIGFLAGTNQGGKKRTQNWW